MSINLGKQNDSICEPLALFCDKEGWKSAHVLGPLCDLILTSLSLGINERNYINQAEDDITARQAGEH